MRRLLAGLMVVGMLVTGSGGVASAQVSRLFHDCVTGDGPGNHFQGGSEDECGRFKDNGPTWPV